LSTSNFHTGSVSNPDACSISSDAFFLAAKPLGVWG